MGLHQHKVYRRLQMIKKERDKLIQDWHAAKAEVAKRKEELAPFEATERKLRLQLTSLFPEIVEGTKNVLELGNGYSLRIKQTYTRKVDTAVTENLLPKLREKQVPVDMLYKTSYELDMAIYRKLNDDQKSLVDETFTLKPDMITAELKTPNKDQ